MYQTRMKGYYPYVVQHIVDYQAIIDGEYPEFELLAEGRARVTNDAYLLTMGLDRVKQWEKILGITSPSGSPLESRRAAIVARIRAQSKLNTETINAIVNAFTGGTSVSWVENSVLYIEIIPNPESFEYKFASVATEIKRKLPAHLGVAYKVAVDVAKDSKLYIANATTYGLNYTVNVEAKEGVTVDVNLLKAIVITHGESHYMEVRE